MIWVGLVVVLPLVFLSVSCVHQSKWTVESVSNTPFECGIEPISSNRVNLYIPFFFLSLLFVVFDLEIAAILPLALLPLNNSIWSAVWSGVFLVMFLGVVVEMEMNSLDWKE